MLFANLANFGLAFSIFNMQFFTQFFDNFNLVSASEGHIYTRVCVVYYGCYGLFYGIFSFCLDSDEVVKHPVVCFPLNTYSLDLRF